MTLVLYRDKSHPGKLMRVMRSKKLKSLWELAILGSPSVAGLTAGFLSLVAFPSSTLSADVTGSWKSEFHSQIGVQKYTFTFKQDGTNLTGKANAEANDQKREVELSEGKVEGATISFVEMLNYQGNDIRIAYSGKLT